MLCSPSISQKIMRTQIIKLKKRHSTKNERRFMENLKRNHIPFKYKFRIEGREIDFIIGNYAVEINGHLQDTDKNEMLVRNGYIPVHINNNEIKNCFGWLIKNNDHKQYD